MKSKFANLLDCFLPFCNSNEDVKLVARLKYFIERGFIEFSNIYDIYEASVHEFRVRIQDTCTSIDVIGEQNFYEKIIKPLNDNSEFMMKMFPNLEMLQEYEQFFSKFEAKYKATQTDLFLSQHRLTIETAKGGLHWAAGQRTEAVLCFIQCVKTLVQISLCELNSNREPQDK